MEMWLAILAACLVFAAQFATLDTAAVQFGLYALAIVTAAIAILPGLDIVKSGTCIAWSAILIMGIWWTATSLYATRPMTRPDDPPLLSDTQQLAEVYPITVADAANGIIMAQILLVALPAFWALNWIRRYP